MFDEISFAMEIQERVSEYLNEKCTMILGNSCFLGESVVNDKMQTSMTNIYLYKKSILNNFIPLKA